MRIEIDKIDYDFIKTILLRAKAHWELDMTDATTSQSTRDRCRENAKMAKQAVEILYDSEIKDKV
jgi:hypothetical protein